MTQKSSKGDIIKPTMTLGDITRRDAIKSMAALALTPVLSHCGSPENSAEKTGVASKLIDTVVVIMMENRSFDHYLGALSLVEGRQDIFGLQNGMSNPHPDGGDISIYPENKLKNGDLPHSWSQSHLQFNGGLNNGFVKSHFLSGAQDNSPPPNGIL